MRGLEFLDIRWRAIILVAILIAALWGNDVLSYITNKADKPTATCEEMLTTVGAAITAANYCMTDQDCKIETFQCPFGCSRYGTYINKNEEAKLLTMIEEHSKQCGFCVYDCIVRPTPATCIEGKCEARKIEESNE